MSIDELLSPYLGHQRTGDGSGPRHRAPIGPIMGDGLEDHGIVPRHRAVAAPTFGVEREGVGFVPRHRNPVMAPLAQDEAPVVRSGQRVRPVLVRALTA